MPKSTQKMLSFEIHAEDTLKKFNVSIVLSMLDQRLTRWPNFDKTLCHGIFSLVVLDPHINVLAMFQPK